MCVGRLVAAAVCGMLVTPLVFAEKARSAEPLAVPGNPPLSVGRPVQSWPKVLPEAHKPASATDPKGQAAPQGQPASPGQAASHDPSQWSAQEIELAQARCKALLQGLAVVAVPELPIREGSECGTPAPMKLLSIGKNPQVSLSPPPVVTCDVIAALHKWLERDVQPLARKHLGGPVIRIDTMSSYSCRNAYGRAHSRLSEHGRANALDIGAFVTSTGRTAMVVADWGPTAREIAAQAAADAKGEPATQQTAAPPQVQPHHSASAPPAEAHPRGAGITITIPGTTVILPGGRNDRSPELSLSPLSRLGGPKGADGKPPVPGAQVPAHVSDGRMDFLRGAHRAGCRIFGTVLGPEANNAHKNHFHVDMAERQRGTICE
jgi:hypothetical protein